MLAPTKTGGAGLGLAMCKAVLEGLGGSVGVESEVGVGSVFAVRIPVPEANENTVQQ